MRDDLNHGFRQRRWLRLFDFAIVAIIFWLFVRLWCVEGLIVPHRVWGPSMAPALAGAHRAVTCGDCGFAFACDAALIPADGRVTCPLCGFVENDVSELRESPGDRLLVDRSAFAFRRPRRWEAVVFRCPMRPDDFCIKRVVGFPGEKIEIAGGDVYVDGRMASKPLAIARRMAILVDDTRRESRLSEMPPRWAPKSADSLWKSAGTGFQFREDRPRHLQDAHWLVYRHLRRSEDGPASQQSAVRNPPGASSRVTDNYAANQSLSRTLNSVADLMLVGRLKLAGEGRLLLRADMDRYEIDVSIDLHKGRGTYHVDAKESRDKTSGTFPCPGLVPGRTTTLEFIGFDARVRLAIDGELVFDFAFDLERAEEAAASTAEMRPPPFGLSAAGIDVDVETLQVFRDIFYTCVPEGMPLPPGGRSFALGADSYFLLGDNSPLSQDSRTWSVAGVPAAFLVGKPLVFKNSNR